MGSGLLPPSRSHHGGCAPSRLVSLPPVSTNTRPQLPAHPSPGVSHLLHIPTFFLQNMSLFPKARLWQEDEETCGNMAALTVTTAACELHEGALGKLLITRLLLIPAGQSHLKLHQVRFRLDIRENFFMGSVIQPWHRLFRTAVEFGVPPPRPHPGWI